MIDIKGVSCGYGNKRVIDNLSFSVETGRICGLIGPNGAGKSTLIKCIMGYIKPEKGDIQVNGSSVVGISEKEMAKKVSYVAQSHDIAFSFSVMEMVLMGRTPYLGGLYGPKQEDYDICLKELEAVGMIKYKDVPFHNLSGGQKQLCFLARAFSQDTPVLILDEPTTGLDYKNQMVFWKMIRESGAKSKTVIVSVHDPSHVIWFCDDVLALKGDGALYAKGPAHEVIQEELLKGIYDLDIDIIEVESMRKVIVPQVVYLK
ncbi:MAG: ABC transporter ATP-binding protein [Eubacterium sp.]|nr:ABC transporter ATP-binding protein [Eubacterium sp.]